MDNFRLIIGLPEMFANGEWGTIDAILTTGLEKYCGPNDLLLALGDGVKQMLTLMAVSDIPEEIRRKHLSKLIASADFHDFFELLQFEFATVAKAPVREEIKRMLEYNALAEINWAIERMSLEEVVGLTNYLAKRDVDIKACLSLTLKIYDERMMSRKTMLLLLSNCIM